MVNQIIIIVIAMNANYLQACLIVLALYLHAAHAGSVNNKRNGLSFIYDSLALLLGHKHCLAWLFCLFLKLHHKQTLLSQTER